VFTEPSPGLPSIAGRLDGTTGSSILPAVVAGPVASLLTRADQRGEGSVTDIAEMPGLPSIRCAKHEAGLDVLPCRCHAAPRTDAGDWPCLCPLRVGQPPHAPRPPPIAGHENSGMRRSVRNGITTLCGSAGESADRAQAPGGGRSQSQVLPSEPTVRAHQNER